MKIKGVTLLEVVFIVSIANNIMKFIIDKHVEMWVH